MVSYPGDLVSSYMRAVLVGYVKTKISVSYGISREKRKRGQ